MSEFVQDVEVVTLSFPGKESGTKFVWWGGISLSLRCVKVKSKKSVNVCSICGGSFVKEFDKCLVDFPNQRRFGEKKDSL